MSVPDIWIERVHLGEGTAAMERAIEADPEARAKLAALESADAAFRTHFDAGEQLAAIERKLHLARTEDAVNRRSTWRAFTVGLVPALAALAVVAVALPVLTDASRDGSVVERREPGVRDKGSARVLVFQRGDHGPETVARGEAFHEGSELQLGFVCQGSHAVLLSLDGRGTVTVHTPRDTAIEPGRHLLDHGYALDDAPDFERFFLVCDDSPLPVDAIVAATEELGQAKDPAKSPLDVPGDPRVADFAIKKVSR